MRLKILFVVFLALAAGMALPARTQAVTIPVEKTLTGKALSVNGNQVRFTTSSGATYMAEASGARVTRKYGTPMNVSEILPGDKLEVRGNLWPDNSINGKFIRNMSLYPHTGTFSGKVATVDPDTSTFTMQMKNEITTVNTDSYTTFKKNGSASSLSELYPGVSVKVKGQWERNNKEILAKSVQATIRLINITATGRLMLKGPSYITVSAENNVIYGLNLTKAKLTSKNNKAISVHEMNIGDTIRFTGKHLSESPQVEALTVKDQSVTK